MPQPKYKSSVTFFVFHTSVREMMRILDTMDGEATGSRLLLLLFLFSFFFLIYLNAENKYYKLS
jgi:hypothetical protein